MGKDYYRILGVAKDASQEEIKKSYRKLALKWHPDRVPPEKKDEAQKKFQDIGEAFEVLSDPEKKRVYDQVGEEGLKGGFPEEDNSRAGGTQFHFGGIPGGRSFHFTNADDIFRNFFGTTDPFQAEDTDPFAGNGFSFMMGGFPGRMKSNLGGAGMGGGMDGLGSRLRKADAITHELRVSLEEVYSGATKRVRITKRIADASGQFVPVSVEKEINIKPGWKNGTKITFEREGDEMPGIIPADIVFVVQAKPHDRFERDGDNLIYICPVTLYEALCGVKTSVMSLDGHQIAIEAKNVNPETVKIIPGEGMPNNKSKTKGDLRVKFRIIFPDLTESERIQMGNLLRNHSNRK